MENTAWRVRVSASGRDSVTAYVRQHQFDLGAPVSFDSQYGQISALEYLLAALGAELTVGLQALGRRQRLRIEGTEAVVRGELANPLVYLDVVGEDGYPGLGPVTIKIYVSTDEPPETIDQLWHEVLRRSPLVQTLQSAIPVEITLQIVE